MTILRDFHSYAVSYALVRNLVLQFDRTNVKGSKLKIKRLTVVGAADLCDESVNFHE
jgi:hypothetical protein